MIANEMICPTYSDLKYIFNSLFFIEIKTYDSIKLYKK